MTKTVKTKVLVVGGGPGGYVAAIRAGQLGLDTTLVEADRLGGTCLIRGCIPSKALIHVASKLDAMSHHSNGEMGITLPQPAQFDIIGAVAWKDDIVKKLSGGVGALLKKAKVNTIHGWAVFSDAKNCTVDTKDGPVAITADHVILATGSEASALPHIPFSDRVISSTEALSLEQLPKNLVVIGAGYIGLELGIAFRKLGVAVTIVEAQDRILPLYDKALTAPVQQWLDQAGVTLHLGAKAQSVTAEGLVIETNDSKTETLPADKILVTVGRKPRTKGWGLENLVIDRNGAFIKVDDRCQTSTKNVWAIGDLVGEPMLAHKASAQGELVAEIIAGHKRRFDPVAIPAVCFTEPEIVTVGLSPDEATAQGLDIITGIFPFAANGRSLSMESGVGFTRVVARRDNQRIVGIQAVGEHVSELSGEFALALEMGAVIDDIAGTIHAHPTLSETFPEAALKSIGKAIHI